MINIGILENNLLLPEGYREGFATAEGFRLAFSCWGLEGLEEEYRAGGIAAPDVVLVETGRANTVRTLRSVKALFPGARLLVLSAESSDEAIREALGQGVQGYLTLDLTFEELAVQVRRLHEGRPVLAESVLKRLLELYRLQPVQPVEHDPELTPRENDIARCLCRGLTYKQIGRELNLSVYTVNQHLKKMYLKKGVNSRHELASRMMGTGSRD